MSCPVGGGGGAGATSCPLGGGCGGGGAFWAISVPLSRKAPAARADNSGLRDFMIETPCQNILREVVRISAIHRAGPPLPVPNSGSR